MPDSHSSTSDVAEVDPPVQEKPWLERTLKDFEALREMLEILASRVDSLEHARRGMEDTNG